MIRFLDGVLGPKSVKPLIIILGVILAVCAFGVARCIWKGGAAQQAEQTTKSGEALADAAENAVETVTNAHAREASIDTIVEEAAKEIDNAPSPEAARAATLRAVCVLEEYRLDPACTVQQPNP